MIDISIVFPAYNEEDRIGNTLITFNNYMAKKRISYELIVVDDGSTDKTIEYVETLQQEIPQISIVQLPKNKGKGNAIRVGMLHAKGNIRLFSDADGSTPIEEIDRVIEPLLSGKADISIGSRYLKDSIIKKDQPLFRKIWSRFANGIVQKILLPGIVDPHCGFKAFKAETAIKIFSQCQINEWSFDLEVLSLARLLKAKIIEIPVKWFNNEASKGKISHLPKEIYNVYKIKRIINSKKSLYLS